LLIRSADELQQRRFEPIRYIVPGYVAEGCTLLAGRPKLGKSWLVLEMGLAIAGGASCLGGI
jgi:RecA-family ATPase